MIEAEGLSKFYGSYRALNQLSFSVAEGEIVGFLGPNGAGKSTTMNILTGFLALSEGTVRINGCDLLTEARQARANVGYLPEQLPLYLELTVREYLHHICSLKKIKHKARKTELDRILPMCHISEVTDRKIAHLSKGFRQRVGLAQALIGSPPLLILDEPTVGLDPQQIQEIRKLISQLSQKNTILLSSHILSEIETICERVLILKQGHLVADDQTKTLSKKINAESCELELEILPPGTGQEKDHLAHSQINHNAENLLAHILAEQGIRDFQLSSHIIDGEYLFRLQFGLQPHHKSHASFDNKLDGKSTESAEYNPRQETIEQMLQPRKELSQTLFRSGFTIVSMQQHKRSLEDIFISLTDNSVSNSALSSDKNPQNRNTSPLSGA